MAKNGKALRTISEVEELLGIPQHQLRYWETKIDELRPLRRTGRNRLYHPEDLQLIAGIKKLYQGSQRNVEAVKKTLKEKGVAYVAKLHPIDLDNIPSPTHSEDSIVAMARKKNVTDGYSQSRSSTRAADNQANETVPTHQDASDENQKQKSIERIYSRLENLQKRMETTARSM